MSSTGLIRFHIARNAAKSAGGVAFEALHRDFWRNHRPEGWYESTRRRALTEYVPFVDRTLMELLPLLDRYSIVRICDIGTGSGAILAHLRESLKGKVNIFTGIDLSASEIEKNRTVYPETRVHHRRRGAMASRTRHRSNDVSDRRRSFRVSLSGNPGKDPAGTRRENRVIRSSSWSANRWNRVRPGPGLRVAPIRLGVVFPPQLSALLSQTGWRVEKQISRPSAASAPLLFSRFRHPSAQTPVAPGAAMTCSRQ